MSAKRKRKGEGPAEGTYETAAEKKTQARAEGCRRAHGAGSRAARGLAEAGQVDRGDTSWRALQPVFKSLGSHPRAVEGPPVLEQWRNVMQWGDKLEEVRTKAGGGGQYGDSSKEYRQEVKRTGAGTGEYRKLIRGTCRIEGPQDSRPSGCRRSRKRVSPHALVWGWEEPSAETHKQEEGLFCGRGDEFPVGCLLECQGHVAT